MGTTKGNRTKSMLAVLAALLMIFTATLSVCSVGLTANAASKSKSSSPTKSQQQAVNMAKSYLKKGPYSRYKLAATLKMNGVKEEDAIYAARHCGANWNEQAARMAKEYMKYDKYTKQEMIEALEFQGFSKSQAEYGAKAAGLK